MVEQAGGRWKYDEASGGSSSKPNVLFPPVALYGFFLAVPKLGLAAYSK